MDELTAAMTLLWEGPLCMVAIDPVTLKAVASNSLFEEEMGPLFKFCNDEFSTSASEDQVKLRDAIQSVVSGKVKRSRIRDIKMTTLAGEAGPPVRKRFDWFISKATVKQDIEKDMIIIMGDASSEQDVIQRGKDADGTGRKIKEARATLLLEETKRSLKMLDNFMGRTLHHMRTPLHVTQHMINAIVQYTQLGMTDDAVQECQGFLQMAAEHIASSTNRIDDISDLAKFDQGSAIHLVPQVTDIEKFGRHVLALAPETDQDVDLVLVLDVTQPGPSMAIVDTAVLLRVLKHLVANAASVTANGNITVKIGYCSNNRLAFTVSDTGPGLEMAPNAGEGDLPTIFQRYHMELLPEEINDLDQATRLRDQIEQSVANYRSSDLGIGLSLSYHLVQALGGELRCNSSAVNQGTAFSFALPLRATTNTTVSSANHLASLRVVRKGTKAPAVDNFAQVLDRLPAEVLDEPPVAHVSTMSVISDEDTSSKQSAKRPRFDSFSAR